MILDQWYLLLCEWDRQQVEEMQSPGQPTVVEMEATDHFREVLWWCSSFRMERLHVLCSGPSLILMVQYVISNSTLKSPRLACHTTKGQLILGVLAHQSCPHRHPPSPTTDLSHQWRPG